MNDEHKQHTDHKHISTAGGSGSGSGSGGTGIARTKPAKSAAAAADQQQLKQTKKKIAAGLQPAKKKKKPVTNNTGKTAGNTKPKPKPRPNSAGNNAKPHPLPPSQMVVVQPTFVTPMKPPKHHATGGGGGGGSNRGSPRRVAFASTEDDSGREQQQQPNLNHGRSYSHDLNASLPTVIFHRPTAYDATGAAANRDRVDSAGPRVTPRTKRVDSELDTFADAMDRHNPPPSSVAKSAAPPPLPPPASVQPLQQQHQPPPAVFAPPQPIAAASQLTTGGGGGGTASSVQQPLTAELASRAWFNEMSRYLSAMDSSQRTAAQQVLATIRTNHQTDTGTTTDAVGGSTLEPLPAVASSPQKSRSAAPDAANLRSPTAFAKPKPRRSSNRKSKPRAVGAPTTDAAAAITASPQPMSRAERRSAVTVAGGTGSSSSTSLHAAGAGDASRLSVDRASFKELLRASYSKLPDASEMPDLNATSAAAATTPAELVAAALRQFAAAPPRLMLPARSPVDDKLVTAVLADRDRARRRALERDGTSDADSAGESAQLNTLQINSLLADSLLDEMVEANTAEVSAIYDAWIDSLLKAEIGKY